MLKEAEGVIKLVEKVVSVADRAGALPGIVRAMGKKYEVDVETPLKTRNDDSKQHHSGLRVSSPGSQ